MEFKEYMKRSFLEHIEHIAEYNLENEEFFHLMQSYIDRLATQEMYAKDREIMGYADYLMNKLHDYADIQKTKQTPAVTEMIDNLKDGEALITFVLDGVEYPQNVGEAYECLVDAGII
ncbi:hypothetical protein EM825_00060 [Salmonella enterica subsp. enterica serovar Redlands]|nr:hypothetical protein [Salmonella enterica subsp. enterica serovar Redlands]